MAVRVMEVHEHKTLARASGPAHETSSPFVSFLGTKSAAALGLMAWMSGSPLLVDWRHV